ncbi:winged helix-turn-helix transcriptional regulator [Rhizosphaericola mali]|uniref:Helix-turn-helix transcriptional regulator n=1 Tax=Rhizosphaericola mali TaxID=2545455 RepID=A0A5P2G1D8_9BACT|nr:helix-turn-helix domain-containing protein [Rhizosphaericola mali]QES88498.1 helix-turn-helix transcriptional regulator [Rhizosphaericola mali]
MAKRKENSTNMLNEKLIMECDLLYAINKVGGRWKLMILSKLQKRKLRFSEIKREIPTITERMLALQLRELEKDEFVKRTVYAEVPPKVDYELTAVARELIPVWRQLENWAKKHRKYEGVDHVTP